MIPSSRPLPLDRVRVLLPWLAAWLLLAAVLLAPRAAQAQTLDEVQVIAQGREVVLRVGFNANVRFALQSPAGASDAWQITWELVTGDLAVLNQPNDEVRYVNAQGGLPDVTITYPADRGKRLKQLRVTAATALAMTARQGPDPRAIDLVFTLPPGAAAAEPPPAEDAEPAIGDPVLNAKAAELMRRARAALVAQHVDEAVQLLNEVLRLPPNASSREAQEWVGVAWERAGDNERARTEYQLYLRLYPKGAGALRVQQRLAALGGGAAPTSAAASGASAPAGTRQGRRFTGDIAQYYYGGRAKSQSLTTVAAGIDQATLTRTTESALITNLDLSGRQSTQDTDITGVLRGTNSINFSQSSHAQSLMNAAYVDYQRSDNGLGVRLGRQSAINGGLLGLFDGLSLTYPATRSVKVDLMGGAPANPLVSVPQERLVAGVVEIDGLVEHWGGDAYLLDQTTQGITNRRAVGVEVRYSGESGSMYSLVDGDLVFHRLNAISLQGSWLAPGQLNVTLLLDQRNAPTLALTNALISTGAGSLKDLLQTQSLAQVRAAALATTAKARQALLSLSKPLGKDWQVQGDLRYSAVGALPAVGNFEATPATGAQVGATVQLTGSNLYSAHDVDNLGLSMLSAPTFKGWQLSWSNLTGLSDNAWTLEPSLSLYTQHDDLGVRQFRTDVGLRTSYKLSPRASLTEEMLYEHSTLHGPLGHASTSSAFFYIGYRYDFR